MREIEIVRAPQAWIREIGHPSIDSGWTSEKSGDIYLVVVAWPTAPLACTMGKHAEVDYSMRPDDAENFQEWSERHSGDITQYLCDRPLAASPSRCRRVHHRSHG